MTKYDRILLGDNMKLDIVINKYLLIWYLLYQSSVSEEMHKLKQKLWKSNKKDYTEAYREKDKILSDLDNYIPDDDTIYNLVESSEIFQKIKKDAYRYRLTILELWDKNKTRYKRELNKIMKCDLNGNYTVCTLHPNSDVVETNFDLNIITIGKRLSTRDKDNFLTYLIYKIVKNEFAGIKTAERDIVDVITELVATNELYSAISKESKYILGKRSLRDMKVKLYPYWLMYLGVEPQDYEKYMVRDNIYFDVNEYTYQKELKNLDIYTFINFVIKNKRQIFDKKAITVEDIEVL